MPYIARELREGGAAHLYRHDVESLFYGMLMTTRHAIGSDAEGNRQVVMQDGVPPRWKWLADAWCTEGRSPLTIVCHGVVVPSHWGFPSVADGRYCDFLKGRFRTTNETTESRARGTKGPEGR